MQDKPPEDRLVVRDNMIPKCALKLRRIPGPFRRVIWLVLICGLFIRPVTAQGIQPTSTSELDEISRYVRSHQKQILQEFMDLLKLPNVSSDTVNIELNAHKILQMMENRGIRGRLLRVPGAPPLVYGYLDTPGALKTVTFYAHYDGQPVSSSSWHHSPWEPVLRDRKLEDGGREVRWMDVPDNIPMEWRLYARSASDDKAAIVGLMVALDALKSMHTVPSINVKFAFEGEEEAGSGHLAAILARYSEDLKSDLWIGCDGPVHQSGMMQVDFGNRGISELEITAYGPAQPLHSGHYGNWAPNPIVTLATLVAGMRDAEAHIRIPGFYDDVHPITKEEDEALNAIPPVDAVLREKFQIGRTEGSGQALVRQLMLPALNVDRFEAGNTGPVSSDAIPSEAKVFIDFRLVPNQTPDGVQHRVESYLTREGFFVVHDVPTASTKAAHANVLKLEWLDGGYPPQRTEIGLAASQAFLKAVRAASTGPVVVLPTSGGSSPTYILEHQFLVPVIGLPIANFDNNQHGPDENIRLPNLWEGIRIYGGIFRQIGADWR
jgi:acetylornithine deacetylase/succinyl-diaminopimelate desuccinylase-like protein